MLSLLRAELWVLGNLVRCRAGWAALARGSLPVAVLALLSWHLGRRVPPGSDAVWPGLVAGLLALVATIAALSAQRLGRILLRDGTACEMLLASPAPRSAPWVRAWLRLVALNMVWGCALCTPFLILLAASGRTPVAAVLLAPAAVLLVAASIVAAVLAVHAALNRSMILPRCTVRRARRAAWPGNALASMLRKDLAWLLQREMLLQTLVAALLGGALLHLAGLDAVMHPPSGSTSTVAAVPESIRRPLALLGVFFWVVVLAVPGLVLAAVQGERANAWLLAGSPASPAALLGGKAIALGAPLVLQAAVFAAWACMRLGLGAGDAGRFLVCAAPLIAAAVVAALAVATAPVLARTAGEPLGAAAAVVAMVLVLLALAAPGLWAWLELRGNFARGAGEVTFAGVLAFVWTAAAFATAGAGVSARRHVRSLLAG
jgi:hypothetical protein